MDNGRETEGMNGSQFEFRSVSKTYDGRTILAEVSFIIPTGEHTAILGPSGCGKSTALRLLAGLEAPSAGQVLLDGCIVSQPNTVLQPPHLRGVAMVFQDLALWPNLSVMDNVLLGLSGVGLTKQEARTRASEALALCAIESLAQRKPGTISGGEQQRAALARAIAGRPSYLLLDEPFSGLDLITKAKLLGEIAVLAAERRVTLLLVTHDPLEATTLCRFAIVLNNGRIEESGILADLLRTSQSQMLKIFRTYRGERLADI
jgi:ABC-type Fe3+/spermidine/putrescine transport system ATPase subunit